MVASLRTSEYIPAPSCFANAAPSAIVAWPQNGTSDSGEKYRTRQPCGLGSAKAEGVGLKCGHLLDYRQFRRLKKLLFLRDSFYVVDS